MPTIFVEQSVAEAENDVFLEPAVKQHLQKGLIVWLVSTGTFPEYFFERIEIPEFLQAGILSFVHGLNNTTLLKKNACHPAMVQL